MPTPRPYRQWVQFYNTAVSCRTNLLNKAKQTVSVIITPSYLARIQWRADAMNHKLKFAKILAHKSFGGDHLRLCTLSILQLKFVALAVNG